MMLQSVLHHLPPDPSGPLSPQPMLLYNFIPAFN
jgi:hypothetical protein